MRAKSMLATIAAMAIAIAQVVLAQAPIELLMNDPNDQDPENIGLNNLLAAAIDDGQDVITLEADDYVVPGDLVFPGDPDDINALLHQGELEDGAKGGAGR